jgi:peptidyl-prolyl cis-trans isomerase D
MTMLDRMRRHKNWLKWSLALVCLAFILFYIPAFLRPTGAGAGPHDVLAEVEGRPITVAEFQRVYFQQLDAYRTAYGASFNERLLRQLGIHRQLLQQLIDEQAALAEAERLGLSVTDEEVRQRILTLPAFLENGRFIGEARYRQVLRQQRPPLTPAEFESALRRTLLIEKLRSALTDWMTVSDEEVAAEFRLRNEQVKLELVAFTVEAFRRHVSASDQDVAAYFEAHKEEFRMPEKRRIRFLLIDVQALRSRVTVSPQDVERYYHDNFELFSTPEQIRASHILFKTEGKDQAAVRKTAEAVLAKAKAGADFAALARQYSEDDSSRARGGDLDFFGRGRMVPEFEDAAFALQPGQVSDLVKTQFGFHIIKLTERRPATQRPLDEVRQQIVDQLQWERAQAQAEQIAAAVSREIDDPGDFDTVARRRGLSVQESGLFARDEPIPGLGPAAEVAAEAFALARGRVAGPLATPRGYVFITVTATQDPYLPKLEEVRDRVRDRLLADQARELARARARAVAVTLKTAADFQAAARRAGLEPKTTEFVRRGTPLPDIGTSPAVEAVVFRLSPGQTSDPIDTDEGVIIARVVDRKDVTPAELAQGRAALRTELIETRRSRFFSAYMTKAKERMRIEINRQVFQQLIA